MQSKLWFLYGNDRELALDELERIIRDNSVDVETRLKIISILTYIGAYDNCEYWLKKFNGHEHIIGQQSWYRIYRFKKQQNPWKGLLGENTKNQIDEIITSYLKNNQIITIDLVGGIGDQIENAALIWASIQKLNRSELIKIKPNGENSMIVDKFLEEVAGFPLSSKKTEANHLRVSAPWFRHWLGEKKLEKAPIRLINENKPEVIKPLLILICWRCKIDINNPLSSFSRSVPFRRILAIYKEWESSIQNKKIGIIDISEYREDEHIALNKLYPWVKLYRNRIKSLRDTRQFIGKSHQIITVDTSLVHLCAAIGRDVSLILNKYPDERWCDLLSERGSYKDHVKVFQQTKFHDWEAPIRKLNDHLGL
jgi:hypothetical protein